MCSHMVEGTSHMVDGGGNADSAKAGAEGQGRDIASAPVGGVRHTNSCSHTEAEAATEMDLGHFGENKMGSVTQSGSCALSSPSRCHAMPESSCSSLQEGAARDGIGSGRSEGSRRAEIEFRLLANEFLRFETEIFRS